MNHEQEDNDPAMRAFRDGMRSSEEEADRAEEAFRRDSSDLGSLARFLGQRFKRSHGRFTEEPSVKNHVVWLIQHHPGSALTQMTGAHPFLQDYDRYTELRKLWLAALEQHPSDVAVIRNAARFFEFQEAARARDLLKQALLLVPGEVQASQQLAHLNLREVVASTHRGRTAARTPDAPEQDLRRAKEAVAILEASLASLPADNESSTVLMHLVKAASAAREWDKVDNYARRLLESASTGALGWMQGNALYYGNSGIGLAAFHKGDRDEAKRRLLSAARTTGSPQLNSFGPNVTLAVELLRVGERDTVLEFFEQCRNFWEMGGSRLDAWRSAVLAGKQPNFGANIVY